LAQFGYPLTEEFFEPVGADNKLYQVQYFERNRFEYHPENKGTPYEVLLGVLGLDFRKADPPVSPVAGSTYFKETGHNLSSKFKEYWDTHGGLFVHGFPITEPVMEKSTNGKEYLVQWFERSRFELHPENAGTPYEVLLGVLGRQLSEKKGYPYGWYPHYGYAPDFSWISGEIELIVDGAKANDLAGCVLFRYEKTIARVQLSDREGRFILPVLARYKTLTLVAFGHFNQPGEPYVKCSEDLAHAYIVERAQPNPHADGLSIPLFYELITRPNCTY